MRYYMAQREAFIPVDRVTFFNTSDRKEKSWERDWDTQTSMTHTMTHTMLLKDRESVFSVRTFESKSQSLSQWQTNYEWSECDNRTAWRRKQLFLGRISPKKESMKRSRWQEDRSLQEVQRKILGCLTLLTPHEDHLESGGCAWIQLLIQERQRKWGQLFFQSNKCSTNTHLIHPLSRKNNMSKRQRQQGNEWTSLPPEDKIKERKGNRNKKWGGKRAR